MACGPTRSGWTHATRDRSLPMGGYDARARSWAGGMLFGVGVEAAVLASCTSATATRACAPGCRRRFKLATREVGPVACSS